MEDRARDGKREGRRPMGERKRGLGKGEAKKEGGIEKEESEERGKEAGRGRKGGGEGRE